MSTYNPVTTRLLSFHDAVDDFISGKDTPRDYLERCIATIEDREPDVKAFVVMDLDAARAAADASTARYKSGTPLSLIDGMPMGIKDLYDTADLPTQMNSKLFEGLQPDFDAASVYALKQGGAVIIGKTTTTEFGLGAAPPTRNPFDLERTPGGSSSGTAAAVGASMLPAATGSQVGGSIIRPAAYCANYGFKPTFGALNRAGGRSIAPSGSHLGTHAGSLEDMWQAARQIAHVAGPDAGHTPLLGPMTLPEARKPQRLVRMYTGGWELTDEMSQHIFEDLIDDLRTAGIEIVEPDELPVTAALEASFQAVYPYAASILGYEMRWPVREYCNKDASKVSEVIHQRLELGENMTADDYQRALAFKAKLTSEVAAVAGFADGFISLASPGPAPMGITSTGNSAYQVPSSLSGMPTMTLPLLASEGLPLGVQIGGFHHGDATLVAHAAWLRDWRLTA
jgi:Asp-tRNA(Asn)/Glu-tRNA(Gln) amidotransferase A subunit family amidase